MLEIRALIGHAALELNLVQKKNVSSRSVLPTVSDGEEDDVKSCNAWAAVPFQFSTTISAKLSETKNSFQKIISSPLLIRLK